MWMPGVTIRPLTIPPPPADDNDALSSSRSTAPSSRPAAPKTAYSSPSTQAITPASTTHADLDDLPNDPHKSSRSRPEGDYSPLLDGFGRVREGSTAYRRGAEGSAGTSRLSGGRGNAETMAEAPTAEFDAAVLVLTPGAGGRAGSTAGRSERNGQVIPLRGNGADAARTSADAVRTSADAARTSTGAARTSAGAARTPAESHGQSGEGVPDAKSAVR